MKNILILTDFSNNSWNSIEYALALFQNESCNFYLLNALNAHEEEFDDVAFDKLSLSKVTNAKDSKNEFDKLIEKLSISPLKGNNIFIPITAETDIIEATKLQVIEKNIDFIVIGTDVRSSFGRKNLSTIFEEVITKVKCSILVVPNEAHFKGLKEVAFPTDYTNFHEAKLLENISDLFSSYQSILRFVYLAKKDETLDKEQLWNKETLQDYFIDQSHSFHSEINNNFELSIESFIDKMGVDLVIMAAKNLNLFEQILFRPHINTIKYYLKTPFLILH